MIRKKVLVAEDDNSTRLLLEKVLNQFGYDVVTAKDGQEAWDRIQQDPRIRFAVLDWVMPALDGPEVCRRIAEINAEGLRIYPVLVSATKPDSLIEGLEAGAFDFMSKPLNINELRNRLAIGSRLLDMEDSIRLHVERWANFQNVLLRLNKERKGDLLSNFHRITEEVAKTLTTARVGIWLFEEGFLKVACADVYCLRTGKHDKARQIKAFEAPKLFAILKENRSIISDDVRSDERLSEIRTSYLDPAGISSVLITQILHNGFPLGFVCAEHLIATRRWIAEEQEFMIAIADITSLSFESAERMKAEAEIIRLNEGLEQEIATRTAELALANARNEAILAATSEVSIIATDTQGITTLFNPGAEKMLGYSANEVVGKQTTEMFHMREELEQRSIELTEQLGHPVTGFSALTEIPLRSGSEMRDWTYVRKDGGLLSVRLAVTPIKDAIGNMRGFLEVAVDMTQIREAHERIHILSRQNQMILDAIAEGIFGVDSELKTIFINPSAEKMLGYSPGEFIGRPLSLLTHHDNPAGSPQDAAAVQTEILATIENGTHKRISQDTLWRKDGSSFPVEYTISPLIERDKVVGAVMVFQDISDKLRQEDEQARMEMELNQARKLESIGQLAAGIAHEINTPIQFVGDNLHFLKDASSQFTKVLSKIDPLLDTVKDYPPAAGMVEELKRNLIEADVEFLEAEIPKAIDQSIEGTQRVSKIVRAMRDFAHPDSNEEVYFSLNRAVETTVTVARNAWKYVSDLNMELEASLPEIPGSQGQINQVILNLIINAVDAISDTIKANGSEQKGTITVRTRDAGETVEMSVSDTGCGIPDSIRQRVFDPFFTTKPVGKGTGQGLSIVYTTVVKKHGGAIRLESVIDKGTTFFINLPKTKRKLQKDDDSTVSDQELS